MCGRFISGADELSWSEYCDILRLPTSGLAPEGRDVYPGQPIAVAHLDPELGDRVLEELTWGLVPSWATDVARARKLINVRGETAHQKFRVHFRGFRCVIPAAGFYEWKKPATGRRGERKVPYKLLDRVSPILSFAGLWGRATDSSGDEVRTCAIITTDANDVVRPIHDRMPVILPPEALDTWLDPKGDTASLRALLVPYRSESFVAEPLGEPGGDAGQLSLL